MYSSSFVRWNTSLNNSRTFAWYFISNAVWKGWSRTLFSRCWESVKNSIGDSGTLRLERGDVVRWIWRAFASASASIPTVAFSIGTSANTEVKRRSALPEPEVWGSSSTRYPDCTSGIWEIMGAIRYIKAHRRWLTSENPMMLVHVATGLLPTRWRHKGNAGVSTFDRRIWFYENVRARHTDTLKTYIQCSDFRAILSGQAG